MLFYSYFKTLVGKEVRHAVPSPPIYHHRGRLYLSQQQEQLKSVLSTYTQYDCVCIYRHGFAGMPSFASEKPVPKRPCMFDTAKRQHPCPAVQGLTHWLLYNLTEYRPISGAQCNSE